MAVNIEFLKQVKIPYNVFRPINTTNSSIDINPNARVALLMQSNTGNQLGEPEGWGSFYDIIKLALDAINTPQTLSILGSNLTISGGNTIALPSATTLYNANSTLTSNRIVTMGNFNLSFSGSGSEQFNISSMVSSSIQATTLTFTTGVGAGIQMGTHLDFLINPTSELRLNGDGGTAGQVIVSGGAGIAPTWGSAASTLAAVLAVGNSTGANNIIVDSGQVIKSGTGNGTINLRDGGIDGSVGITSDNGTYGEGFLAVSALSMSTGYGSNYFTADASSVHYNSSFPSFSYMTHIEAGLNAVGNLSSALYSIAVADNTAGIISFKTIGSGQAITINSGTDANPTVFNAGVINSVALGGRGMTIKTSNAAYANQVILNDVGSAFEGIIYPDTLSADRSYILPDTSGKISVITVVPTSINYLAKDGDIVLGTGGALGITVTLPNAALFSGMQVTVKKVDAGIGDVGVTTAGGNLEGVALPMALLQNNVYQYTSDGTDWWITGTNV